MEHKFYTDNFERLLKEQSDEFRMYPSKRVWHSIYNDLHPDRKWPSIAVSLVLVTVLFLIGYWNNNLVNSSADSKQTAIQVLASSPHNSKAAGEISPAGTGTAGSTVTSTPGSGQNKIAGAEESANTAAALITGTASITHTKNQLHVVTDPKGNFSTINKATDGNVVVPAAAPGSQLTSTGKITAANAAQGNAAETTGSADLFNEITGKQSAAQNQETAVDEAAAITGIAPVGNSAELLPNERNVKPVLTATALKTGYTAAQPSTEDKIWMEHYALYNKHNRSSWKGRFSNEIYITPGVSLRSLKSNTGSSPAAALMVSPAGTAPNTSPLTYVPGLSFEIGTAFSYSFAKNFRVKAGIQANFTNYNVEVTELNHPVMTSLLLNNLSGGSPYLEARGSSLANVPGLNKQRAHNQTSQIGLPIGLAVKLAGNKKIDWYFGSTIQPTYVFSGKANLVSADHNNYVADASMIRNWNLNTAAETYIHYKMNGATLQVGPELRYQIMSTYSKKYTYNESLYNIGVKVGIVKDF